MTVTLARIHKDFARITCDNVDPGGSINGHLGQDPAKTLQGLPVTMLILGGQLTVTLGRIHKDFARITCDNVDPGRGQLIKSPWEGSLKTLQGLPVTMLILGVN